MLLLSYTQLRLDPVLLKLDHTTEDQIGFAKLAKVDLFVTALDNVAARNTVERISHMYNKPMIDGGTEGFEGSQENFIPNVTNEYLSFVLGFFSFFFLPFSFLIFFIF